MHTSTPYPVTPKSLLGSEVCEVTGTAHGTESRLKHIFPYLEKRRKGENVDSKIGGDHWCPRKRAQEILSVGKIFN